MVTRDRHPFCCPQTGGRGYPIVELLLIIRQVNFHTYKKIKQCYMENTEVSNHWSSSAFKMQNY